MKILLASFHTPGIFAIQWLFQYGVKPENIALLSYDTDNNTPLMAFAKDSGIAIQATSAKSKDTLTWVQEFKPDLLFSLYYRHKIPNRILDLAPLGAVNLHPSLLPKYRGAFSAPWTIIHGEKKTGISYHYMTSTFDAGNIILQKEVPIEADDTAYALYHRLLLAGVSAFGDVFRKVAIERDPGRVQVGEPTYFPRGIPFDGYIAKEWGDSQVERFIRAMIFPPYEGAKAKLENGEVVEITDFESYQAIKHVIA